MKLLLVAIHIEPSPRAVPLGPAMLASALRQAMPNALTVELMDLYLTDPIDVCLEKIQSAAPHYIGFSVYVWNRERTLAIARHLKQACPETILFAGGPEPSAEPEGIMRAGTIDFILTGEAEGKIVNAMRHLLAGGAAAEAAHETTPAPTVNLDTLPSPILDGTLDTQRYTGMLWELSRGCPFKCDFCYESRGRAGIRRFPEARIRQELAHFTQSGVEQIFVLDPTFNYNREQAKEILKLIRDEAPETYFFFEVRSEFLDADMAELFGSIGCSLQIGLQSASDTVLRNINRTIDTDDFTNKILLLHEAGAAYGFDLIYGLPGDTLEGFCASLDFAMGLAPNHIDIFPLAVLPGTRLHDTAPSFGLIYQPESPYHVLASPLFGADDMAAAQSLAHACTRFYNDGQAVPWFAMVLDALEMSPSTLFAAFAEHLTAAPETADLLTQQIEFIQEMLAKQGQDQLIPVATDIIAYFGIVDSPHYAGRRFSFTYNPDELLDYLESGVTSLNALAECLA